MQKRLDRSLKGVLLYQFWEFWPYYLGAFVCLWATHTIQSYLPFKAQELAEMVDKGAQSIPTLIFVYFALGIIVFRTASRLLFFYPARVMQKYLRVELLTRLENVSPLRYRNYSAGQLFQVMFSDLEQLRALVGFALLQVGNIIIAVVVLVPKIVDFHPGLLVALTPMLLAFALFTLMASTTKELYRKNQELQGEVQNFIMESYVGKKTIKNYHAEGSFIELFKRYSFDELIYFYRAGLRIAASLPLVPLGVGLSFIWGAFIIRNDDLGASSLILFSGFVFLFLEPLMFLSWIGIVFSRSYASWQRIKALVTTLDEVSTDELRLQTRHQQNKASTFFLDFWKEELPLEIIPSQWNVLVGKTGHGKTHLLQQLAEVYKLREQSISYVAQDPYLYNDNIISNIFLGHVPDDQDKFRAFELLKLFQLDFLAPSTDELFALEVGENGKRLSGGQAKRLALVRSLMSDAEILIWDDPFSSVDVILEKMIIQELKKGKWLSGKTLILTSHRLTTVRHSDRVVYIAKEQGIIEEGQVQQLLGEKGLTYAYFENQLV